MLESEKWELGAVTRSIAYVQNSRECRYEMFWHGYQGRRAEVTLGQVRQIVDAHEQRITADGTFIVIPVREFDFLS